MGRPKKIIKEARKPAIKKTTIVRQMTFGHYCQALWALENPEQFENGLMLDVSIYKAEQIEAVGKRRFYVTDEQRQILDKFCRTIIVKKPVRNILATLEKDPKYLTKPDGQTYRYKSNNQNNTPVSIQPAVAPQIDADIDMPIDIDNQLLYTPTAQYSIYSDEERMQLAIRLQRKPADKELINQCGLSYFDTVDMSQYLFIKDLNRQVQDVSDIDYHVLFYMIETSKINSLEAKMVLIKVGAGGIPEKKPHDLIKYGVPRFYDDDSTLLSAMIKAETFAYKYDKMLKEDNPSPEYIFERFKDHIGFEKFPCVKHSQMCEYQYDENVEVKNIDIQDDTVIVTYDDIIEGDEGVKVEVRYNDRELLLNDFFCFEKTFNLDPNKKFNVWGEDISINDYVKQLYIEYPHGINGDFYATMKEAYEAGHACINEIA